MTHLNLSFLYIYVVYICYFVLSDSFTKEAISGRDCVPICPLKFYAFPRNKEYLTQPFVL